MAWIEVHQSLPPHRKIKRLKRLLKVKTPAAVGHVIMLWLWALDNAPEGRLDGLEPEDLAEAAEWPGDPDRFMSALVECGFVDGGDDPVIHDWQEYGGRLQDQRKDRAAQNRERQKRYRESKKTRDSNVTETQDNGVTVTERNANVTRYGNVTETQDNGTTLHNTTLHYITTPNGVVKKGVTRNAPTPPTESRACDAFMAKISPSPSSASMQELLEFEREMGSEVCLRAIDAALDNNARTWSYVRAILRAKKEAGVRSIEDWNRMEAQHMDRKQRRVQGETADQPEIDNFDTSDTDKIFKQIEKGEA